MIRRASTIGVKLVKFQLFTKKEAPGLPKHLYLNFEQAKSLFQYGKKWKVDVFFTPMYLEAVDWCEEIGVKYYKIRHKDQKNYGLVKKVLDLDKMAFISTSDPVYLTTKNLKYLYCVPEYPAKIDDYYYPPNYAGISDHTHDLELLENAIMDKVEYFEKHVKLEGTKPLEDAWSVTFEELGAVLNG